MRIGRVISLLLIGIYFFTALTTSTGCANIMPPGGGPRDSLPPVLLKSTPFDSTLNFQSNRIVLNFDEYVEIDNYQQNLIVSPVPEQFPTVNRNLQTITVRLRDSLEANTTYTLNFGNSIKDVNEGNIYKNFTYTFSTGNYIDSLQFGGNVILAETGAADSTLTVLLHKSSEDSALVKQKPRYVTRLDKNGYFNFKNLAPGTYYVYALKDEGGSYRYMSTAALFAFADSAIVVNEKTPGITLYAYATPEKKEATPSASTTKPNKADKRLRFTTNLRDNKQDLLSSFEMQFEIPLKDFDSTRLHFTTDSTYQPVTGYSWVADSLQKKYTLQYTWQENTLYHFILEKEFATDTLGQQLLKSDTLSFSSKKKSDYGKLNLRFRNLDFTKNPVLQFVQNNTIVKSIPLSTDRLTQELFVPGDYDLRILEDKNNNGVWDPGIFMEQRLQPERVKPLKRKLTIKVNMDVPIEIDAAEIVLPGMQADAQPTTPSPVRGIQR